MPDEAALDRVIDGELQLGAGDAAVAALADAQHGVVARAQLIALGFTDDGIDHRVAKGRLHRIHRGVFSVGHRVLYPHGRWKAAVLAAGPDAALSHRSAAALHGILPIGPGAIHLTLPRPLRARPGLVFHRARLPDDELDRAEGIPTTGLSRTLLDLAGEGAGSELERALHEADVKRLVDRLSLEDLIARYPGRRGVAAVREALADRRVGASATRSELEERFLAFLAANELQRPEINVPVNVGGNRLEVDCLWRDAGLVVELDGRATHLTTRAFERDRERDRALQAAGWRVLRVTWRQVHDRPEVLAADLRKVLGGEGGAAAAGEQCALSRIGAGDGALSRDLGG